ncbi:biotin/lipoyl-containing protein [Sphingomonas sp. SRS2]|uniref:biotin/lipoyl-containing protein n=1 Tax=Sphingomonas sp. SRS2 TaxID=133190 RepID=UPI00061848C4|nr:lipoyl domain-containing protein [Sphingomonas sp. SRS2]KKC25230.1 dihydrolipoamide acyltransferase [Sphingomonas sp. SRS2]
MATEIKIPQLGFSMTEATIAEWLVADGSVVTAGQPLYAIEADKSTQEIESPTGGAIRLIGVEGETYEIGTVIAEIE